MRKIVTRGLLILFFAACGPRPHARTEIEAAMIRYDSLLRRMDGDSIALMFTPDGMLGPAVKGRDSIRRFLSGFGNVRVLSVSTTSDSLQLHGDSALQQGDYRQIAVVDQKDTFHIHG